ncbi:hypothetical protein B0J13DRAFT_517474 [Dactylonectria estremocensis]|uniref:Uncharacterized protein n=1 Tax=Dactylonectria estremocensis TaxID=1079267 RepID=A0A9P9FG78_9HYPO|nr:hypothetical protein B0J13DRAFT_517474 [Dactylonectria estremocensis]
MFCESTAVDRGQADSKSTRFDRARSVLSIMLGMVPATYERTDDDIAPFPVSADKTTRSPNAFSDTEHDWCDSSTTWASFAAVTSAQRIHHHTRPYDCDEGWSNPSNGAQKEPTVSDRIRSQSSDTLKFASIQLMQADRNETSHDTTATPPIETGSDKLFAPSLACCFYNKRTRAMILNRNPNMDPLSYRSEQEQSSEDESQETPTKTTFNTRRDINALAYDGLSDDDDMPDMDDLPEDADILYKKADPIDHDDISTDSERGTTKTSIIDQDTIMLSGPNGPLEYIIPSLGKTRKLDLNRPQNLMACAAQMCGDPPLGGKVCNTCDSTNNHKCPLFIIRHILSRKQEGSCGCCIYNSSAASCTIRIAGAKKPTPRPRNKRQISDASDSPIVDSGAQDSDQSDTQGRQQVKGIGNTPAPTNSERAKHHDTPTIGTGKTPETTLRMNQQLLPAPSDKTPETMPLATKPKEDFTKSQKQRTPASVGKTLHAMPLVINLKEDFIKSQKQRTPDPVGETPQTTPLMSKPKEDLTKSQTTAHVTWQRTPAPVGETPQITL